MKIQGITSLLEKIAPVFLQEDYDNCGLITGNPESECSGILISLDATEDIIREAVEKNCNLVIAHHPIVFRGLKKITGKTYVEQTIIRAIKNDIAIYAIHTNLDNVIAGVNGKIAEMVGLINQRILAPKSHLLQKLAVYVPVADKERLMAALFDAGAGSIGNYNECSFSTEGMGSFRAGEGTNPHVGQVGERHYEQEAKLEVIFPAWLQNKVLHAMRAAHPYEEVAYDIYGLENQYTQTGSGIIGELASPVGERELLVTLQDIFKIPVIKHTAFLDKPVKTIAICGGAGSFLTAAAIGAGADAYITADIKYHEFFDAGGRILLADIGHYESEQFTIDLLFDILTENFPNFAVLKTGIKTNPVHYFGGQS